MLLNQLLLFSKNYSFNAKTGAFCDSSADHEKKITKRCHFKCPEGNVTSNMEYAPKEYSRVFAEVVNDFKDLAPPPQLSPNYNIDDVKRELFRLTTFQHFPHNRVEYSRLTRAGFFYTGSGDRVQCFVCLNITSATASSNPFDPEMHRSDCGFMDTGTGFGNISLNMDPLDSHVRDPQSDESVNRETNNENRHEDPARYDIRDRPYQSAQPSGYPDVTPPIPPPVHELPFTPPESSRIQHQALLRRLNLCRESDRLQTFASWPTEPPKPSPSSLARTGFSYLGNSDRVECFSCKIILRHWHESDNPRSVHLSRSPDCAMALRRENRNIPDTSANSNSEPLSTSTSTNYDLTEEEQLELRRIFPCSRPTSPDMRNMDRRVTSFTNWRYTRATVREIAEAGFFYLDARDRTKCFYCNGGLQNWCFYDNPWEEHAKWYPTCEYLLQSKGQDYVQSVTARYPNINRPALPHSRTSSSPQNRALPRAPPPPPQPRQVHQPVATVPSAAVPLRPRRSTSSILEEAMQSEVSKIVIDMGFEESTVREANRRHIEVEGVAYKTASDLLTAAMEMENNLTVEPEQEDNNLTVASSSSSRTTNDNFSLVNAGSSFEVTPLQQMEDNPTLAPTSLSRSSLLDAGDSFEVTPLASFNHHVQAPSLPPQFSGTVDRPSTREQDESNPTVASTSLTRTGPLAARNSYATMTSYALESFSHHVHAHSLPLQLSGAVNGPSTHVGLMDASPVASLSATPQHSNSSSSSSSRSHLSRVEETDVSSHFHEVTEDRLCRVCFSRSADILLMPCNHVCSCLQCTQTLRQCPICSRRIERAIRTFTSRTPPSKRSRNVRTV